MYYPTTPQYTTFQLVVNTVDLYSNSPQALAPQAIIPPNPGSGGNGGIGLRVYNIGAKNLIISVKPGALVAGGGGGGGAGTLGGTGGNGGDGLADGGTTTVYDDQGACNAFRACYNICFGGSGYQCTGTEATISQNCNINYINKGCTANPSGGHGVPRNVDNADTPTTGGIGGPGGSGANGGNGEEYNSNNLSGGLGVGAVTDWAGRIGGTDAGNGGPGGTGGNGGEGGEFGKNGNPGKQGDPGQKGADGNVTGGSPGTAGALPVGNGGNAGKAIDGLNYILNPSPPPSGTIRGTI